MSTEAHNIDTSLKKKIAGTPNSDIYTAGASVSALTPFLPHSHVKLTNSGPDYIKNTIIFFWHGPKPH